MSDPGIDCDSQVVIDVDSPKALVEIIRASTSVLAIGSRTKAPLSSLPQTTRLISMRGISGIIQYEPSEFTFTAHAGTTISEINGTLARRNQYLPFDPMLVQHDATLGGTVAAGMSGPGRMRFGGVRDFILGADFIAGDGQQIRSGGKVVKNAAGFDIPKLLVGSCGRLGAITALTFKVFPKPIDTKTFSSECPDHTAASRVIAQLARGRWEIDAIDYSSHDRRVWIRLGGPAGVCREMADDLCREVDTAFTAIDDEPANAFWRSVSELSFPNNRDNLVAKVPLTLQSMRDLANWCDDDPSKRRLHASVAGSLGWLAFPHSQLQAASSVLAERSASGMVVRGLLKFDEPIFIGDRRVQPIEQAVKLAMDPPGRFPTLSR